MTTFKPILVRAAKRAGGAKLLEEGLIAPNTADALRAVADDRYLSLMSLRVFRAGLKHSLVDARWPAFEEVFHGFEPYRVRAMNDEDLREYQYMFGMEDFTDHFLMAEHANYQAALDTVEKNLAQGSGGVTKVYAGSDSTF